MLAALRNAPRYVAFIVGGLFIPVLVLRFMLPEHLQYNFDYIYGTTLLLPVVVALFLRAAGLAVNRQQRTFFRLITLAFGGWLLYSVIRLAADAAGLAPFELTEYFLYLVYWCAVAAAIELRSDMDAAEFGAQRHVTAAIGSVLLIIAVFSYFAILPLLSSPRPYAPPYALYCALDAYLCVRFLVAYAQSRNRSWRRLYLVASFAWLLIVGSELLSWFYAAGVLDYEGGNAINLLWWAWYPVAIFASGLQVNNEERGDAGRDHWRSRFSTSALLPFGAVLPLLHAVGYAVGWFALETRQIRDIFVALWIVLMTGLFFGLYQVFRHKVRMLELARTEAQSKADKFEDQLERELRLRSLGRLSAGLAHDFGNAITVIDMYASLIAKGLRRGEAVDGQIKGLSAGVNYAQDLVTKLKQFGGGGKAAPVLPLDVDDEIRDILQIIGPSLAPGIDLRFARGINGVSVLADASMISQVVANFVHNAADVLRDNGRIEVTVSYSEAAEQCASCGEELAAGYVKLTVSDSGPGVNAELAATVFEPLVSTKPVGKGSGLGLSTVHGIMHSIGGHVGLGTSAAGGAAFSAYFRPAENPDSE